MILFVFSFISFLNLLNYYFEIDICDVNIHNSLCINNDKHTYVFALHSKNIKPERNNVIHQKFQRYRTGHIRMAVTFCDPRYLLNIPPILGIEIQYIFFSLRDKQDILRKYLQKRSVISILAMKTPTILMTLTLAELSY